MRGTGKQPRKEELRQKIVETAWRLFEEKGYENTTVNEIIDAAGTSKGGFYYYFKAKEDLLSSLYLVFDREYRKLYEMMDKQQNAITQLLQINQNVACFIESNIGAELLTNMYIAQLSSTPPQTYWGDERYYKSMLYDILSSGQERGEIRTDVSTDDLVHDALVLEAAVLVDWCMQKGSYSLGAAGSKRMERFFSYLKPMHIKNNGL